MKDERIVPAASNTTQSGLTPRVAALRQAYLEAKPSVSIARAKAVTEVYRANPGMPPMILRAMGFKRACETAP
ncbi:pyruvate formate lyase family protein, partial [Desulfovibrio sp. DV]|uniref:pyruvate formate lyase family protein n=1 Tax=Desulfovibrio sp. DV TaxID=1844708 RepID=UPI0011152097